MNWLVHSNCPEHNTWSFLLVFLLQISALPFMNLPLLLLNSEFNLLTSAMFAARFTSCLSQQSWLFFLWAICDLSDSFFWYILCGNFCYNLSHLFHRLSESGFLRSNVLNFFPTACLSCSAMCSKSTFRCIGLCSLDFFNLTLVTAISSSWFDMRSAAGIVLETFIALFQLSLHKI